MTQSSPFPSRAAAATSALEDATCRPLLSVNHPHLELGAQKPPRPRQLGCPGPSWPPGPPCSGDLSSSCFPARVVEQHCPQGLSAATGIPVPSWSVAGGSCVGQGSRRPQFSTKSPWPNTGSAGGGLGRCPALPGVQQPRAVPPPPPPPVASVLGCVGGAGTGLARVFPAQTPRGARGASQLPTLCFLMLSLVTAVQR